MLKTYPVSFLIIISLLFPQKTYEFTEEEVKSLYASIQELEYKDSLNTEIIEKLESQIDLYTMYILNDSTIIAEQQIQLTLKDMLIEEIRPRWWENKYLWFGYGAASVIIPIWAIGQLK